MMEYTIVKKSTLDLRLNDHEAALLLDVVQSECSRLGDVAPRGNQYWFFSKMRDMLEQCEV